MRISMYQASVPVFTQMLNNLAAILEKGAAHAAAKKIDPAIFLNTRLYPDMFSLSKQVQAGTDMAKAGVARLAGQEPPKYEHTETTFADLVARINKTVAYINTFKPEQIDGSEEKPISFQTNNAGRLTFIGMPYLLNFVLPNFYFQLTAAHNILRHSGVEIGKKDFLGEYLFVVVAT